MFVVLININNLYKLHKLNLLLKMLVNNSYNVHCYANEKNIKT